MKIEVPTICKDAELLEIACMHLDTYLCKTEAELEEIIKTWRTSEMYKGGKTPYALIMANSALIFKQLKRERNEKRCNNSNSFNS